MSFVNRVGAWMKAHPWAEGFLCGMFLGMWVSILIHLLGMLR